MKRDAADKWFSDVVRAKAAYTCENCHQKGRMECCHIFGRAAKSLEFTNWLETYLGKGHLEILREKWNVKMQTNKALRLEISKHYREEFKKMERDELYQPISYN
jgi:hypothetical protein